MRHAPASGPGLRSCRQHHAHDGVEQEAEEPEKTDEPTIIRGNDRMFAPPKADPGFRATGSAVSLKFEQAPVADMVHAVLGDILKLPYVINDAGGGTVTLHTQTPLSPDKVFPVFESVLQANGLVVVKDASGVYHVGRPESMRGVAPSFGSVGKLPAGHNMVVVPLRYVGAAEMADILKPVASPEAFVRVDTFRNLLILAGTQGQIGGWMEIVNTFDIDILKGMSIGLFPLKHTSVQEVDAGLKALLAGTGTVGGGASGGGTQTLSSSGRGASGQGQGGGGANQGAVLGANAGASMQLPSPVAGVLRVVALEKLNALLVITPRAHYLDTAREWITKLDQPRSGGSGPQLYVYPVQNGTAEHLAELLSSIFGGESQAGSGQRQTQRSVAPSLGTGLLNSGSSSSSSSALTPRLGSTGEGGEGSTVAVLGDVRVVADKRQNALLIYAPRGEYAKIEAALRKLDIAPTQILIEASILEVTLNNELRYGLLWYFNGRLISSGTTGSGQLTSGDSSIIGAINPGFSYTITNSLGDVRAVLTALAEKSLLNVISSPSIMVLDNHTATIQVGDQQPIRGSSTVSENGNLTTQSIQYKDTGVMLSVSPSVNAGGMVTMDVEQSVTDVGQVDVATGQRTFLQRQLASRIAVRDGETVVLGGLIRDNNTVGKQGIPLLHDLPVLGHLFGTTSDVKNRTELLVMLTPRVLRNEADLRQIGDELKQRMRALDMLPQLISADFHRSVPEALPVEDQPLP